MSVAKCLGNQVVRLIEVLGGIHQIAGRLHCRGAPDIGHDTGHGMRVAHGVFTGSQDLVRQQGFGKRLSARQIIRQLRQVMS